MDINKENLLGTIIQKFNQLDNTLVKVQSQTDSLSNKIQVLNQQLDKINQQYEKVTQNCADNSRYCLPKIEQLVSIKQDIDDLLNDVDTLKKESVESTTKIKELDSVVRDIKNLTAKIVMSIIFLLLSAILSLMLHVPNLLHLM